MESLLRDIHQSNQIVFVCSGNIIRSAFAELYTRHVLGTKANKSIRSLGTDYHNTNILDLTRKVLIEKEISPEKINNFHPTHISEFKVDRIDDLIFFSMTNHHQSQLENYFGKEIKSYLLPNILDEDLEIEDPYFTNNYERVFLKIEECVNQLANYCIN
ncbi:MAG: hypothetical protein GPJ54_06440 [Candidatus Heimdallarchaeota archaeon]|nr:hypothetical protein [Candidatus Heimdallarchaeota archaeon]